MVALYKLGGGGYVHMLLNVADLKEFGRAYRMVSALASLDRQRAVQHQQNLVKMKQARASLQQHTGELTRLQGAAVAARAAADRAAAARER